MVILLSLNEQTHRILAPGVRDGRHVGRKSNGSSLEDLFAHEWTRNGYGPEPRREYRFHPTRRWRFDFAWPDNRVALEVEGGIWTGGRHTRGAGFLKDSEKYNEATILGWTVLRVAGTHVRDGSAIEWVVRALEGPDA